LAAMFMLGLSMVFLKAIAVVWIFAVVDLSGNFLPGNILVNLLD